jgi:ribonuclease Y
VESGALDDSDSTFLAKDIAKKIEKEMSYPGEVKVTVIRETRAVEFAR